jgi:hypothetical protein
MWISSYWYEKLPALYAGAALLSLALLGTPAGFSAAVLMGAAGLTSWLRYSHRRQD